MSAVIDADLQIGDPIVFVERGTRILGRVSGFSGDAYRGVFPIIHLITPHGSTLHGGRLWFKHPSEEDLVRLEELDRTAGLDSMFGAA